MSEEQVKVFFAKVEQDEELGRSYKSLLKGMADAKKEQDTVLKEIVEFASGKGFEFTADELKAASLSSKEGELSEDDLDAVAGGGWGGAFVSSGDFQDGAGSFCVFAGYKW